jgi:hypothetical protein
MFETENKYYLKHNAHVHDFMLHYWGTMGMRQESRNNVCVEAVMVIPPNLMHAVDRALYNRCTDHMINLIIDARPEHLSPTGRSRDSLEYSLGHIKVAMLDPQVVVEDKPTPFLDNRGKSKRGNKRNRWKHDWLS